LTEIDRFKVQLAADKFDLDITQMKKKLKDIETDEDKCDYYDLLSRMEDLE